VKKKSPPYAIFGAAVLGIICVVAFVYWKKGQDQAAADNLAKVTAGLQQEITDLQTAKQVTVTSTPTDMRNVYYATEPVQAGEKISPNFFEKKLTPNGILPDAYPEGTDMADLYAIRNIEKGDPLTPRNVGKSLPYLTQRISPGMRAVSLPIFNAEYNNTGGFAIDGDRVDLLYTTTPNGIVDRTQLVMQNVNVLYVPGPKIESEQMEGIVPAPPPGAPISITFEVTPEQAQALILMSQQKDGKFSMILRARSDKSEIKIKPFVAADYYGNFQKVQRMDNKSQARVEELAKQIEAEQKAQEAQGTTNETNPTPPTP
jgi:Flp pilus assembly protein CpaB